MKREQTPTQPISIDETAAFTFQQREQFRQAAEETGESEAQAAERLLDEEALKNEPETTARQVTEGEKRHLLEERRRRAVGQLNVALEHAGTLRSAIEAQSKAESANEVEAFTKLVTTLVRNAPIIVPSNLDNLLTGARFASTFAMPLTDQPFADGMLPELDDATYGALGVKAPHKISMLREPRVLLLKYKNGKFGVESTSLVDIIGKALANGVAKLPELNATALENLPTPDRETIERAAKPKK